MAVSLLLFLCSEVPMAGAADAPALEPEDVSGYIRLVEACQAGNLEIIQECLDRGEDVNHPDGAGRTPLMHALFYGHQEAVRLLLENGASKRPAGSHRSPLEFAILSGNLDLVQLLARDGIPDPRSKEGLYVCLATFWADDPVALGILKDNGLDLQATLENGDTLLNSAIYWDADRVVAELLRRGVKPVPGLPLFQEPLYLATHRQDSNVLQVLLSGGIHPGSHRDQEGVGMDSVRIPLVNAVRAQNREAVKALLAHGAVADVHNNLPIIVADMMGSREIYNLLRSAGAPEPEPYAYLDLLENRVYQTRDLNTAAVVEPKLPMRMAMEETDLPSEPEVVSAPYRLAVLPADAESRNTGGLVSAGLSSRLECRLVERGEIQQVLRERSLQSVWSPDRRERMRMGALLGADVLLGLRTEDEWTTWTLASVLTGEILDQGMVKQGEPGEYWTRWIPRRISVRMAETPRKLNEIQAVSLPILIPEQGTQRSMRVQRWLQQGISQLLVREPGVVLLERGEMRALALEKSLQESVQNFYGSGWLIDGSVGVSEDPASTVTLRLRIRQSASGREQEVIREGSLADLPHLARECVVELLKVVGGEPANSIGPETEAELCMAYAQRAINANQWETGYRNATAAWVLGKRDEQVMEALFLSAASRIRESDLTLRRWVEDRSSANLPGVAIRCSKLHLEISDPGMLRGSDYFELANQLLDLYGFTESATDDLSAFQRDLLAQLPMTLHLASRPLQYYTSLSDQNRYAGELETLSRRIRLLIGSVREQTRTSHPYVYMGTTCAYLELLPYLFPDLQKMTRTALELLRESESYQYPLNPYPLFGTIWYSAQSYLKVKSCQADKAWELVAGKLLKSEVTSARILGGILLQRQTHNPERIWSLQREIDQDQEKFLRSDRTAINYYWDFRDHKSQEKLKLRGSYQYVPEASPSKNFIFPFPPERLFSSGRYPPPMNFYFVDVGIFMKEWFVLDSRKTLYRRAGFWAKERQKHFDRILADTADKVIRFPVPGLRLAEELKADDLIHNLQLLRKAESNAVAIAERHGFPADDSVRRFGYPIRSAESQLLKFQTQESNLFRISLGAFHPFRPLPDEPPLPRERFKGDPVLWVEQAEDGYWIQLKNRLVKTDNFGKVLYRLETPEGTHLEDRVHTPYREGELGGSLALFLSKGAERRFGVLDLTSGKWTFHEIPELPGKVDNSGNQNMVSSLLLLDGIIAYAYVANPKDYKRFSQTNLHLTAGDTSRIIGVSLLNLSSGEHTPLVVNRRLPSQSPLDDHGGKFYKLVRVDDHRFAVERQLYDIQTGSWSLLDAPPRSPNQRRRSRVHGVSVTSMAAEKPGELKFSLYRKAGEGLSAFRKQVILKYQFSEGPHLEPAYWSRTVPGPEGSVLPRLMIRQKDDILVLNDEWGFYFVTAEEVQKIFQPIVAKLLEEADGSP